MITMGGNAEIELIDSMDPFSEGGSGEVLAENTYEARRGLVYYATQEVMAGYCQLIRWREDTGLAGVGVCPPCVQGRWS
jgi:hypothetical protein